MDTDGWMTTHPAVEPAATLALAVAAAEPAPVPEPTECGTESAESVECCAPELHAPSSSISIAAAPAVDAAAAAVSFTGTFPSPLAGLEKARAYRHARRSQEERCARDANRSALHE
jgi:hypothetical protein